MRRIDVNSTEHVFIGTPADNPFDASNGAAEISALGPRNPWPPSFDRQTGGLQIADIGQGERERVNWQPRSSDGGENSGRAVREGDLVVDPERPGNPALIDPVLDDRRDAAGGFSVTVGHVHLGRSAGLLGVYLYADFVTDQVWSFRVVGGRGDDAANRTAQMEGTGAEIGGIALFGRDGRGSLYGSRSPGRSCCSARRWRQATWRTCCPAATAATGCSGGRGADTIVGGRDDDRVVGGTRADRLAAGRGEGSFAFDVRDSGRGKVRRGVVTDLRAGDQIDLWDIDARAGGADDRFVWVGSGAFSAKGQVRARQIGNDVMLDLDTRGRGGGRELQVLLDDVRLSSLDATDFVL